MVADDPVGHSILDHVTWDISMDVTNTVRCGCDQRGPFGGGDGPQTAVAAGQGQWSEARNRLRWGRAPTCKQLVAFVVIPFRSTNVRSIVLTEQRNIGYGSRGQE